MEHNPIVEDLKKQLREKDLVLTDTRLEALSSASQLESLKETVMKMRQEMMSLKHNNERLQRMVTSRSLAGSDASLSPNGSVTDSRRFSGTARPPLELPLDESEEDSIPPPAPEPMSVTSNLNYHLESPEPDLQDPEPELMIEGSSLTQEINEINAEGDPVDGKKISICVYLGLAEQYSWSDDKEFKETSIIAYTYISGKTTWQNLDYIVRKTFKDYLSKIDPGTNLGLNTDSIVSYHLGEAKRGPENVPELLPCGYIIGNVRTLYICLQGVGPLSFDSLIPRSIVHRYINLLTEHRRLILCGPNSTGKSYLARKLAEFLVARSGRTNTAESIATFK